jgi:Na+/phosphate symporter
MVIDYLWSVALQADQFVGLGLFAAHVLVLFFAFGLFLLSLYAWSRRRQVALALVSSAFLLFCLKEVIWLLSEIYNLQASVDLITVLMDLVVLALFFVAIAHRPRKQLQPNHLANQP